MNYNTYKIRHILFSVFTIALFFIQGCSENVTEPEVTKTRGGIVSTTPLQTYTTTEIQQVLGLAGISNSFNLQYSVEAVKIVYWTIDADGKYIKASGAIMVPKNINNLPLFNMNHGTVVKRDRVASVSPFNITEGVAGLVMGALGYLSCVPDYPGFGESNKLHPYIHAKSIANAVIDFLKSAQKYAKNKKITLNNQLFLAGYSEGGYVTLATQKEIEENYSSEFDITAVAPMAGPYDLLSTATNLIKQKTYNWPAYIGFLLTAYNNVYGWNRLDDFFVKPYNSKILTLLNGTKTLSEVNSQLPKTISELLNKNFIDNFLNGNDTQVINAFKENSLLDWSPTAPIKFYHGEADGVIPYQIVLNTVENLKSRSSSTIELYTITDGTHATSILPSVIDMVDWFETFR